MANDKPQRCGKCGRLMKKIIVVWHCEHCSKKTEEALKELHHA